MILIFDAAASNELSFLSGCTCPGYDITYMCKVCGTDTTTTVWEGSAFQCPENSDEISLRHSQFNVPNEQETGDCSNGAIVGYSIGIEDQDCYVSRLDVTISQSLNGTTVECTFEGTGGQRTINTNTVEITTGTVSSFSHRKKTLIQNCEQSKLEMYSLV